MNVMNRIGEMRKARGWTCQQLASSMGTTQATISRLEADKQSLTVEWMWRIAHVLGVRPVDLINSVDTLLYASVRGSLCGHPSSRVLYEADQSYTIPVPRAPSDVSTSILQAFETESGWLIVEEEVSALTLLKDNRQSGDYVVLMRKLNGSIPVLSVRRLSRSESSGLGFLTEEDDPATRWLSLTDKRVLSVWPVIAEYRHFGDVRQKTQAPVPLMRVVQ